MNNIQREDIDLSFLAKVVTLIFSIVVIIFFEEVLLLAENPFTLFFSVFAESLVFLSAVSPLGLMSVFSADYLLSRGMFGHVVIAFFVALLANSLSFFLGRILSKEKKPATAAPSLVTITITYASPQLASLAAFDFGLRRHSFASFIVRVAPIFAGWFLIASLIIYYFPTDIRSPWVAYVSLFVLLGWILLPRVKKLFNGR
tara:strand:- start:25 stop:627 length:603 start_codon:yes stop_codon:yes gene_type:complete